MRDLYDKGVEWYDQQGVVQISKCIALASSVDSVARATLQNIHQFNGTYGCGFCLHPGQRVSKGKGTTRVYPLTFPVPAQRSHENVFEHATEAAENNDIIFGVKGASQLLLLPRYDMVRGNSPEYMHAGMLGVVRQIVNLTFDSAYHDSPFYMGPSVLKRVDELMLQMTPPSEVRRSPRPLSERSYWKASEWRAFLLYYSVVIFGEVMSQPYFLHWLLLVNAINILLRRSISQAALDLSRLYLLKFSDGVEKLYGLEHVSFNVHLLTHLADSVTYLGPLWAHSAFVFEDKNRQILNMFNGTQSVSVQIVKHFLGLRKVQEMAQKCIPTAEQHVQKLYQHLLGHILPIRKAEAFNEGGTGLGASHIAALSPTERAALRRCTGAEVLGHVQFRSYNRFVVDKVLYTTFSYDEKLKRKNCAVCISDTMYVIDKCVCGKVHCQCNNAHNCQCATEAFIICSPLVVKNVRPYQDRFTNTDLGKICTQVEYGEGIKVFRLHDVKRKCVMLQKSDDIIHVFNQIKFEMD